MTDEEFNDRINAGLRSLALSGEKDLYHTLRDAHRRQQQTFTAPTTLYGEPREELAADPQKAREDVPHPPTMAEQEQFWSPLDYAMRQREIAMQDQVDRRADAILAAVAPTIGELIDRISIVNIKIYHLEDVVRDSQDTQTVCDAARKTRALNRERSDLKNAITQIAQGMGARVDTKVGA